MAKGADEPIAAESRGRRKERERLFELFHGELWGFIFLCHKRRKEEIRFHKKTKIYIRFPKSSLRTYYAFHISTTESQAFTQHL